jgi:cell division septal protein FtsQ
MAITIDHEAGGKRISLAGRPLVFQRGPRSLTLKGSLKRRTLRTRHVLALFALLAGFFFALNRAYLFLITWDRLTVRTIELGCSREPLRLNLERFLRTRPLGNILLCDLSALQKQLGAYSWVKDVRIQKVFPSTLKIDVLERAPFVLLEKNGLALIDEEGTVLEPSVSAAAWPFCPVVSDEGAFRERFQQKWENARACLESLTATERTRLLSLECSDDGRITLQFREDQVRLILDGTSVREKLDRFAACRVELENRFGALDYADLRLDDRIIVRPQEPASENPPAKSQKEAE